MWGLDLSMDNILKIGWLVFSACLNLDSLAPSSVSNTFHVERYIYTTNTFFSIAVV